MSTRSTVALPEGDGFRGRYIHNDGYPSGVGVALLTLIRRDGVEAVMQKLTQDRYGWSSLNPATEADRELHPGSDDGRFAVEPGYGIAYTTAEGQSAPDDWVTDGDDWDTEWAYVVSAQEIQVLSNDYPTWRHVARVRLDDPDAVAKLTRIAD